MSATCFICRIEAFLTLFDTAYCVKHYDEAARHAKESAGRWAVKYRESYLGVSAP